MPMKLKTLFAGIVLAVGLAGCGAGPSAPDVNLFPLGQSGSVKLSSFKGKVVLIDVWATWCGPCRETMPLIQKIYNERREKGLEVVAISGESASTVERFLKENPYTYPFYIDLDNSVSDSFKITGLPTSIVIDRDGNVVFRGHPADEEKIRAAIDAALG